MSIKLQQRLSLEFSNGLAGYTRVDAFSVYLTVLSKFSVSVFKEKNRTGWYVDFLKGNLSEASAISKDAGYIKHKGKLFVRISKQFPA